MTNNKKTFIPFLVGVVAILFVLGGYIYMNSTILESSDTMILKTRPVDPRDLLRGEYVILRYEEESYEGISRNKEGTFWVRFEKDANGIGEIVTSQDSRPSDISGLWVEAPVTYGSLRFEDIDQYFVPEGAGTPIERLRTGIHVEVAVQKGNMRIIQLLDENLEPINPRDYIEE